MNEAFVSRKPSGWHKRPRLFACRLCGAVVETTASRKRYCDSPECVARRLAIKNERRKIRRHLLSSYGFPVHTKGNK